MSIPDELMWSYYELVTDRAPQEITALKQEVASGKLHPMDAKMRLAQEVIAAFHGKDAARKPPKISSASSANGLRLRRCKKIRLTRRSDGFLVTQTRDAALQVISASPKWPQLLKYLSQAESISEAARIVEQGGLEINGKIVKNPTAKLDTTKDASYDVRVGKRKFLRIIVE